MATQVDEKLTARSIEVAVAGRTLLDGLDLSVERGEIVGLSGPSGCGKTTLLRCIAGLSDPASGEVRLGSRSAVDLGYPGFRRNVLYVSQTPTLFEESVGASLARVFGYQHSAGTYSEEAAIDLLARVGLFRDVFDQVATSLSVGEQQRVCLVRALMLEPQFLLLDEPTSALDEHASAQVCGLLREYAEAGTCGMLIVMHDRAALKALCDRTIDLDDYRDGSGLS